jgi:acetylornithine deacetylase/succinyl-diaminopimelate desuccinylase-like protein
VNWSDKMATTSRALAFAAAHRSRFVEELKQLIRFPTVSAQLRHAQDLKRCAAWLADHLRGIGLDSVQVVATKGHPLVYGAWLRAPGRPTLLIYGHYDVQPADPLDAWRSRPFEPVVRGENLYGRGAADDKGQLFAHVKALECYLRTSGGLPLNVRCLFEGEEEIGGTNFDLFLRRHKGFGAEPAFLRVGGSLPMVNSFKEILGIPTVLMGFALPDDRLHGPNEKFHLPNFFNGIATSIFFLDQLAKPPGMVSEAGLVERDRAGMSL